MAWGEYEFTALTPHPVSGVYGASSTPAGDVALVHDHQYVWRSTNAQDWTQVLSTTQRTDSRMLNFKGDFYFLRSDDADPAFRYVHRSTDGGQTWAVWHSSTASLSLPNTTVRIGHSYIWQGHVANDTLYLTNGANQVVRSDDLSTWTATNLTGLVTGVAYGNGVWVVAADPGGTNSPTYYRSTDGVTFSSVLAGALPFFYGYACVVWHPEFSKFFALGRSGSNYVMRSSADGITWASKQLNPLDPAYPPRFLEHVHTLLAVPGGIYAQAIAHTPDFHNPGSMYYAVEEQKGYYIAGGGAGAARFGDGVLLAGDLWAHDVAGSTPVIGMYGAPGERPYSVLLTLDAWLGPEITPEFWTSFNQTYEIP